MGGILYGTHYISEDEPCLALFEMNEQSPDSRGFHRYQIIYVVRDGKSAQFRKDLGLAKKFKHDQFRIPSYLEHTVGELRDMADWVRNNPPFDKRELAQVNKIKE